MFEGMLKHTGQLNNTGKHVVVVFMQLPEDEDHALVIDTDALPDMYNEALRRVVEGNLAQGSKNLADVLARSPSPDGSSQTMLQKFHAANRLMKTPVTNVTMIPRSGVRWPLTDVIASMNNDTSPKGFDDLDPETKAAIASEINKFNVHANNQEGTTQAGIRGEASALLEMAKLLETDAHNKREQAYRMDPSLKPSMRVKKEPVINMDLPTLEVNDVPAVKPKRTSTKKAA